MNDIKANESLTGLEIAVIGMAGRFAGAANPAEFWENLKNGVESITFFSEEELIQAGVHPEAVKSPNYIKAKGMISGVEYFDADFFGYSAADAQMMDPQIRVFYECVWEALENAGYDPYSYQGPIGLFAGATPNLAWELLTLARFSSGDAAASFYNTLTVSYKDFLTTLISYKLNLKGPSVTIQTACSTSLVAVHLACRELLTGGCDIALAGGVCVSIPRKSGYHYSEGMMLSPDGHCRSFDAKAKGTVPAEGAGVVVLKRFEEALEDGDHILAVIKGTGINNDGSDKVGFLAPSVNGQAQLLQKVYPLSEIDPATISYIETHGTGTKLGDPIEINALKLAFKNLAKNNCPIGSVKSNLGHPNEPSGVTGLIKTILAIRHRQIPPSLHYQIPNPEIDFEDSPFYVNTELREWPEHDGPIRAGVSSFGFGGTNAHAILEEAPQSENSSAGREVQLLLLSAKTPAALNKIAANLAGYLTENSEANLADVAYTLQTGRASFQNRRAVLAATTAEAIDQLRVEVTPGLAESHRKTVVFMFPGQGSQYLDMGRELYLKEAEFRAEMDHCLAILNPLVPFDLKALLYPVDGEGSDSTITDTAVAQPLLFIMEYVLAQMLIKWGIKPDLMIGHSIGEYAAACISGVFSLEDAISLVVARGKLMQEMPPGAMLSVPLPERELTPFLKEGIAVAAVNSGSLTVLSGNPEIIATVEAEMRQTGLEAVRLHTSHAFHSHIMDPALPRFLEQVNRIKLSPPKIPYVSNLTGNWITAQEATSPDYWAKHLRQTVQFAAGATRILENRATVLIEVGGGRTLSGLVKQSPDYRLKDHLVLNTMRHPKDQGSDLRQLLSAIGKLWCFGISPEVKGLYRGQHRHRIPLPTYPFERKYIWIDENLSNFKGISGSSATNIPAKLPLYQWFYLPTWKPAEQLSAKKGTSCAEVLIFGNDLEFCRQFVAYLRQSGYNPILVKAGTKFNKESSGCYDINPSQAEDYQALFQDLQQSGLIPSRIIHLLLTTKVLREYEPELNGEQIETAINLGFYSLIYIVQALGAMNLTDKRFLEVITNNMQAVTGNESLAPEKALVLGPVKIIPKEYPNIKCRSIDIELPGPGTAAVEELLSSLLGEIEADTNEPIVSLRQNQRWFLGFEPINLKQPDAKPLQLRPNGVYLITGGTGGIGLTVAKFLAQNLQAKLILTGRTALPPRAQWGEWLQEHPTRDKVSQIIWKVKELEELGGTVMVVNADIADTEAMRQVIRTAAAELGKIDGVFHSAGVADGGMMQIRDRETLDQILISKVKGTAVIDELFHDLPLDFCILCSSIATILPTFGQVGYTAANSFLEAYARFKRKRDGQFTIAINWDTWQEVGMAVKAAAESGHPETLATGLLPQEGIEALQCILDIAKPQFSQVLVSTNFPERYREWRSFDLNRIQNEPVNEDSEALFSRPDLNTPYVAPGNEIESMVAAMWSNALRIEKIGIDDNFFDIGGNSLHALEITNNLRKRGYILTVNELYKGPTIRSVANIMGNANQVSNQSGGDPEPVSTQTYPNQGFPLSAVQQRFLNRKLLNHNIFNVCNLFMLNRYTSLESVEAALNRLIQKHDSLRLSFGRLDNGKWYQYYQELTAGDVLVPIDLAREQMDHDQFISEYCSRTQNDFEIETGSLFKILLFEHYQHRDKQVLYLQFHHLVADGASLQIFIADLIQLLSTGRMVENSDYESVSYRDWCLNLQKYALNQQFTDSYTYWNKVLASRSLAVDIQSELPATHQTMKTLFKQILTGKEEIADFNQALLKFQSTPLGIMLAALSAAVYDLKEQSDLLLHLMSNQRESFIPGTSIHRTMGFFSAAYPIRIKAEKEIFNPRNYAKLVGNIKKILYEIPKEGLDYLVLKYLRPEIRKGNPALTDPCHMLFHFVPMQLAELADNDYIQGLPITNIGSTNSPQNPSAYLLNMTVYLQHDQVKMTCYYSTLHYHKQIVEQLMEAFRNNLKRIIGV